VEKAVSTHLKEAKWLMLCGSLGPGVSSDFYCQMIRMARGHGVRYPLFLALDLTAALVWTSIWVGLGWFLGDRWSQASAEARWVGLALGAAGALALIGFQVWRRLRHRSAAYS